MYMRVLRNSQAQLLSMRWLVSGPLKRRHPISRETPSLCSPVWDFSVVGVSAIGFLGFRGLRV